MIDMDTLPGYTRLTPVLIARHPKVRSYLIVWEAIKTSITNVARIGMQRQCVFGHSTEELCVCTSIGKRRWVEVS
jgi:hypothetical protein